MVKAPCESHPGPAIAPQRRALLLCVGTGLSYYYLTSLVVFLGVSFGHTFVVRPDGLLSPPGSSVSPLVHWDGTWYRRIVSEGYSYDPTRQCSVGFFPGYPLFARFVMVLSGATPDVALVVVANASLAGTFVLLMAYLRRRYHRVPELHDYVLLALGLLPLGLFFRMAYSESLCLFLTVAFLYGIECRRNLLVLATIVGCATAVRPAAVGLMLPLILYAWRRRTGAKRFAMTSIAAIPLSLWGIATFAIYQYFVFGDPFAYVKTQHNHWRVVPVTTTSDKLLELLSLRPLWGVIDPSYPGYWANGGPPVAFSMNIANALHFLGAVILLGVGIFRKWLTPFESLTSAMYLLIPYCSRAYEMAGAAMGRQSIVCISTYLVIGQLASRVPPPLAAALLAVSGFLLGAYAALFAAWHRVF